MCKSPVVRDSDGGHGSQPVWLSRGWGGWMAREEERLPDSTEISREKPNGGWDSRSGLCLRTGALAAG